MNAGTTVQMAAEKENLWSRLDSNSGPSRSSTELQRVTFFEATQHKILWLIVDPYEHLQMQTGSPRLSSVPPDRGGVEV